MSNALLPRAAGKSTPITLITENDYSAWLKRQPVRQINWLKVQEFSGKPGSFCILPDIDGKPASVVVGISDPPSLWDLGGLPLLLPAGIYHTDWKGPTSYHEWFALGWALGSYRFTRYRKTKKQMAQLALSKGSDAAKIARYESAINLARDLINTPAEDMGPGDLAQAIVNVGKKFRARVTQIKGDELLRKNYPAIHTVGRANNRAPRLVDLAWGNTKHPKVTLVGKGVCFDTGGLDIKPSSAMYLMKKDMGGAASALAVAYMIMDARLPVRLRLLIPAVENSVSGNSFRPSDIITMRSGATVEVGNTDAEGRLILADALTEAASENPSLIVDFSTLTGAARSALGTEIAALFCNDDKFASDLYENGKQMEDHLWRMPLFASYDRMLDCYAADMNSAPGSPYAGAITAALFLQRFVKPKCVWAHLDFMAWNLSTKSGRPEGGEAMSVRAVFRAIENRYPGPHRAK